MYFMRYIYLLSICLVNEQVLDMKYGKYPARIFYCKCIAKYQYRYQPTTPQKYVLTSQNDDDQSLYWTTEQ